MKNVKSNIVVLIFVLIGIAGLLMWTKSMNFGRWAKNQYFGEISSIQDSSLSISNKESIAETIVIEKDTEIFKKHELIDQKSLVIGDNVLVIGDYDAQGNIHAKIIRIFPPRRK